MMTLVMIRNKKLEKNDRKRKMDKHLQTFDERIGIFHKVQMCRMNDP